MESKFKRGELVRIKDTNQLKYITSVETYAVMPASHVKLKTSGIFHLYSLEGIRLKKYNESQLESKDNLKIFM